jgi:hypothetical protein
VESSPPEELWVVGSNPARVYGGTFFKKVRLCSLAFEVPNVSFASSFFLRTNFLQIDFLVLCLPAINR